MPLQPDVRGMAVPLPLANVALEYAPRGFIADEAFPIIKNAPPALKLLKIDKGAFFRNDATLMGRNSRADRGGWTGSYIDVVLEEWGRAAEVPRKDRVEHEKMGGAPLDLDARAIRMATKNVLVKKEKILRDLIVATTWVDGNSGGEDAEGGWAPGAGNTFLADIDTAKAAIHAATGFTANRLIMDYATLLKVARETTVIDAIKYTQRGVLTAELLAELLLIDKVFVGRASYSTAKEKKDGSDFTAARIWDGPNAGKGMAFLYYAPDEPSKEEPSSIYQASLWYPDGGGSEEAGRSDPVRRTRTWYEGAEDQDVYEVRETFKFTACGASCGYFWKDTILT